MTAFEQHNPETDGQPANESPLEAAYFEQLEAAAPELDLWSKIESSLNEDHERALPSGSISQEQLNAYADQEVDDTSWLTCFEASLNQDDVLAQDLSDLQSLRDLLKRFYIRLEDSCRVDVAEEVMKRYTALPAEQKVSDALKTRMPSAGVFEQKASAAYDHELSAEERKLFEADLKNSPKLQEQLADWQQLSDILSSYHTQLLDQAPDLNDIQVQSLVKKALSSSVDAFDSQGASDVQNPKLSPLKRWLPVSTHVAAVALGVLFALPVTSWFFSANHSHETSNDAWLSAGKQQVPYGSLPVNALPGNTTPYPPKLDPQQYSEQSAPTLIPEETAMLPYAARFKRCPSAEDYLIDSENRPYDSLDEVTMMLEL